MAQQKIRRQKRSAKEQYALNRARRERLQKKANRRKAQKNAEDQETTTE